ncbi:MAG TPA: hypothetical protein VE398_26865 [Acidobacteriota bacterium]|nr:hypothetical protein [Acidobacteriota bacterium]
MARIPSPKSLAAKADARLKTLSNGCTIELGRTYFKPDGEIWLYGVDAAHARALTRDIPGQAGKRDQERLRRFLLARGPCIPRTAVQYTIEWFAPAERRALLAGTRSGH